MIFGTLRILSSEMISSVILKKGLWDWRNSSTVKITYFFFLQKFKVHFSASTWWLIASCNYGSKIADPLFGLPWYHIRGTYTYL